MTNYNDMTDFQINELIANLGPYKNYCNSWADMGPIMEREKINLEFDSKVVGECSALGGYFNGLRFDKEFSHKNPLRAAAIVFLMMKEGSDAGYR